jgi:hypothetical protein
MIKYVQVKCFNCGTLFDKKERTVCEKNFCNVACYRDWLRTNSQKFPDTSGSMNPRWRDGVNRTKICEWCKKEYTVNAYIAERKNSKFCSKKCRVEWYAKVWSQREEWREDRREWAISLMEDGVNVKNSSTQIIADDILNSLGIENIKEKAYKNFAVDNYLVEHNLIIEVMGTYWHCDIRKYSKSISYATQVNRIRMDKIKHSYMLNIHDIEILYLWEEDLNIRPDLCRKLILLYIQNKGKLDNYHSMNYHMDEKCDVALNKDIIIPYMYWDIEDINKIVDDSVKIKTSKKQLDKWISYSCDFCGKECEELISHHKNNKNHFCSTTCFLEFKKLNRGNATP